MAKKIILRSLLTLLITLVIGIVIVMILLPGMAKDYLHENGTELIGRKVEVENIAVSYWNVSASIEKLTVYESDTINPFISFDTLFVDLHLWDLLSSHVHIESSSLSGLYVKVAQNQTEFNFDDIVDFFADSAETDVDTVSTEPFQYTIEHFDFLNGHIAYHAQKIDEHLDLEDINFIIPHITWSHQEVESGLAFNFAHGGTLHTDFDIDVDSSTFDIRLSIDQLGISPGSKVVKRHLNIGEVDGILDLDVELTGHLDHFDEMRIEGITKLEDIKVTYPEGGNMISWDSLFVDLHDIDLFKKEIFVNEARLYQPRINVALLEGKTSLDSLIPSKPDSLKQKKDSSERQPWMYSFTILNMQNGLIMLGDSTLENPQVFELSDIQAEFDYFSSNDTTSPLKFHTLINKKSKVDIMGNINLKENFKVDIEVVDLDAQLGKGYVKKGLNIGDLKGKIDLKIHAEGPVQDAAKLTSNLEIDFKDFSLSTTKHPDHDFLTWKDFHLKAENIDLEKKVIEVSDVTLDGLEFGYLQYKGASNLDDLNKSPKDTARSEEEKKSKEEEIKSENEWKYNIAKINLNNSTIHYQDLTLEDNLEYSLDKLNVGLTNLTSKNEISNLKITAETEGDGMIELSGKINTYTAKDFDLDLAIKDIVLYPFTPYSYHYIGNNIERGRLSHSAKIEVTTGIIESDHELHIAAFDLSKRVNKDAEHNLPVRLGVEILKDKDANIDLDFQIEGNMNDPDFSVGKLIWKTLGNIVSKAAASPGRSMGVTFGGDTSSFKSLDYEMFETDIDKKKQKELDLIELVLKKKEKLKVRLIHYPNNEKTAAKLALNRALMEFYAQSKGKKIENLNANDSLRAFENIESPEFSEFVDGFVEAKSNHPDLVCLVHYGRDSFTAELNEINQKREETLSNYMLKTKAIPDNRFVIARRKDEEGEKEAVIKIEFDLVDE